jgi:hypothetical protein
MNEAKETFEQYASRISGLEFHKISPEMRVTLNGQYLIAYPPGENSLIICSLFCPFMTPFICSLITISISIGSYNF